MVEIQADMKQKCNHEPVLSFFAHLLLNFFVLALPQECEYFARCIENIPVLNFFVEFSLVYYSEFDRKIGI